MKEFQTIDQLILLHENAARVGKTEEFMRVPKHWLVQQSHLIAESLTTGRDHADPSAMSLLTELDCWYSLRNPETTQYQTLVTKILEFSEETITNPNLPFLRQFPVKPDAAPQTQRDFLCALYNFQQRFSS